MRQRLPSIDANNRKHIEPMPFIHVEYNHCYRDVNSCMLLQPTGRTTHTMGP